MASQHQVRQHHSRAVKTSQYHQPAPATYITTLAVGNDKRPAQNSNSMSHEPDSSQTVVTHKKKQIHDDILQPAVTTNVSKEDCGKRHG